MANILSSVPVVLEQREAATTTVLTTASRVVAASTVSDAAAAAAPIDWRAAGLLLVIGVVIGALVLQARRLMRGMRSGATGATTKSHRA